MNAVDESAAQLEIELRELRRLSHLRRMLELPATLFAERAPQGCRGECSQPQQITADGLTCCHLFVQYSRHNETVKLEKLQRDAVEGRRLRQPKEAPKVEGGLLQDAYPLEHTGTARLRRMRKQGVLSPPSTSGKPKVAPKVKPEADPLGHLKRTVAKLK